MRMAIIVQALGLDQAAACMKMVKYCIRLGNSSGTVWLSVMIKRAAAYSALLLCTLILGPGCGFPPNLEPPKNTSLRKMNSPEFARKFEQKQDLSRAAWKAWREDRDVQRAEALLRERIALDPEDSLAWDELATLFDYADKPRQAIEAYEQATRHRDRRLSSLEADPVVLGRYAELCEQLSMQDKALELHRRILAGYRPPRNSSSPKFNLKVEKPNEISSVAKLIYAESLQFIGEEQRALEVYRQAVKADPDNAVAHFRLGAALMYDEVGRPTAAEQFCIAMKLSPDDKSVQENSRILLAELK